MCMWVKGGSGGHYEQEHPKFMLCQDIILEHNTPAITTIPNVAEVKLPV